MVGDQVSLWDGSAEEAEDATPMGGDRTTDLAVIGAGFTGLSTALHAAEAGMAVHVLEAERIGFGGSGRNVGLVNAGLWLPPQEVMAHLGEAQGRALLGLLGAAPAYVFELIETHQIRCEPTRTGTIHAAHSPKGYADLARRAEGWQALGAPVELLSREEAAARIGSRAYHGGLLDRRAGTINPMGYARGLARAARAAGAEISTGTPARGLSRAGDGWQIRTPAGTLRATYVVLATNAYSDTLWPGLARSFTPLHFFQIATEPLGERAAHILPEGQGLWNTALVMFSLRRDAAGRLILGSMGSVSALTERWARRRLARLFPELGPVRLGTPWHGRIAMTPDHFPRIHRLAEGLYTPIGYSGRGITTGTVFGRAMAALLAGGKAELPLPLTEPQPVKARQIREAFYATAFAATQLARSL
jgi:glycine/D-amino acid oxidase-like deaminating enzyme